MNKDRKHKDTNVDTINPTKIKNTLFCSVKMIPQEVVQFLTLEVVQKLTLERPKGGTETHSPACMHAYIYIYMYIYIYPSLSLSPCLSLSVHSSVFALVI